MGNGFAFTLADTQVGAMFDDGTLTPIAQVSDGSIMGCTGKTTTPATGEVTCSLDAPSALPDVPEALEMFVHSDDYHELTIDKLDALTSIESRQLFATVQHLGLLDEGEDFDAAFATATMSGSATCPSSTKAFVDNGSACTWVTKKWAWCSPKGTTKALGEVRDGELRGVHGRCGVISRGWTAPGTQSHNCQRWRQT